MLSTLLRPKRGRTNSDQRPLLFRGFQTFRNGTPSGAETASEAEESEYGSENDYDEDEDVDDGDEDGEDGDDEDQPILPIFSAHILDNIPVYHLQHSIRILVVQKCETTLSWEQLRSPQVSQFLVKPIQQQIRDSHLNRGTLYALLANCLQFQKDGQTNPGSVGVFRTRAMLCELLAMRLLKESSTRELIDALFYDFDPLHGLTVPNSGTVTPRPRAITRISTVEIAIRAQSKRFLAHPLVVQQLEAIWAGTITFHSAADTLHRKPPKRSYRNTQYGTMPSPDSMRTLTQAQRGKSDLMRSDYVPTVRRSVSLYDPSDASPFKLSRLRVPRYRQIFSTLSYAIMLGLFLAVLVQHSLYITPLEIVFWFWSAGYMLDEIVGFTEQGFDFYILSVWNAFDIGILLMFLVYYFFRLYGILMPDSGKHETASLAYDVLASTAVLLFPRLFSVLDHYRYFSQLMIAFRMMAIDLIAILFLIVVACSGFFVAFTLSFAVDLTPGAAAFALFQLLMGFTPAAWEIWDGYNLLGKAILTIFLIICHFLIVTILITVLTNSFMAVVQNAESEHQYVAAVNTISMVKSDALFSYIPPANIIGWVLTPLRYVISFRLYVWVNRTIIKVTHLPLLLSICAYERIIMSRNFFEHTELVEQRGRGRSGVPAAFAMHRDAELYSPGARLREPSVTTYHKDRALEEVFRRPFRGSTNDRARSGRDEDPKTSNVVHDWMHGIGQAGAGSPMEQPREEVERLENRRPTFRRFKTTQALHTTRNAYGVAPSAISDPEDSRLAFPRPFPPLQGLTPEVSTEDLPQQTDQDGDDELASNEDDDAHNGNEPSSYGARSLASVQEHPFDKGSRKDQGYFYTPTAADYRTPMYHTAATMQRERDSPDPPSPSRPRTAQRRKPVHVRNTSSATILFSPVRQEHEEAMSKSPGKVGSPSKRKPVNSGGTRSGTATPGGKRHPVGLTPLTSTTESASKPRPIFPPKNVRESQGNLAGFLALDRRKPSFNTMALDLASDLGDNRVGPNINILEAMPASFGTQFERAAARKQQHLRGDDDDTSRRLNKLVLARISTLELGFAEVLREVRGLSRGASSLGNSSVEGDSRAKGKRKAAGKERASRLLAVSDGEDRHEPGAGAGSAPEAHSSFGDGDMAERSSV